MRVAGPLLLWWCAICVAVPLWVRVVTNRSPPQAKRALSNAMSGGCWARDTVDRCATCCSQLFRAKSAETARDGCVAGCGGDHNVVRVCACVCACVFCTCGCGGAGCALCGCSWCGGAVVCVHATQDNTVAFLWNMFIMAMLGWFLISIITASANEKLVELEQARRSDTTSSRDTPEQPSVVKRTDETTVRAVNRSPFPRSLV